MDNNLILDGHKLAWHGDRVKAWQEGERIAPISLQIALTRKCNYNCVYCYSKLQHHEDRKITWDVIERFLDDCAEIGVKSIAFVSDGESTLSPFLNRAILHGKNNGLDIALGTNGSLLDNKLEEILPALTYLRFNISSANSMKYAEIHGCKEMHFWTVHDTILRCVLIKRLKDLPVTIGLQMVLMPEYLDQVGLLAVLAENLKVDYLVIKHCADDENRSLGVDYSKYLKLEHILKEAESFSNLVKIKWSKIKAGNNRSYTKCYGPRFMTEISGSGLVASCGLKFNSKYAKKFHIGNIIDQSYKKIWQSDRYWEVQKYLASDEFDIKECGSLCLQHKINEYLWELKQVPEHINFI